MVRSIIPAFVGWAGIIFKVIPLILATLLISAVCIINAIPSYDAVDFIFMLNGKLSRNEEYSKPDETDVEYWKEFRFSITNSVMMSTLILLFLLAIDVSLIRSANNRNHKMLIPGLILYGLKAFFSIICLLGASSDFTHFAIILSIVYGCSYSGIFMSYKLFKNEFESKNRAGTITGLLVVQTAKDVGYEKFENEKA